MRRSGTFGAHPLYQRKAVGSSFIMTTGHGQRGTRAAAIAATAITAGAILLSSLGGRQAEAFPVFATKEKKPCSYCHVMASGGGKRTDAGNYYKAHGNSFAGRRKPRRRQRRRRSPHPARRRSNVV